MDLRVALREKFGFDSFQPGQEEVVLRVLSGQDTLAILATGAGKSLTYQLSALLLEGTTIVVSPLIALMKDQLDMLRDRGIEEAVAVTASTVGRPSRSMAWPSARYAGRKSWPH